jgi:hypothetical protein
MVDNSSIINKTKENLNSDGQQFHKYQQYKRVDIGGIVDQNSLSFLCFVDIGGNVDHQCLSFLCFVDIGRIVDRVLVYNSTNINTAKESLNNDGVQFDRYQLIKTV